MSGEVKFGTARAASLAGLYILAQKTANYCSAHQIYSEIRAYFPSLSEGWISRACMNLYGTQLVEIDPEKHEWPDAAKEFRISFEGIETFERWMSDAIADSVQDYLSLLKQG